MQTHTTITIPRELKSRLDEEKAVRQPYSGFIEELLEGNQK